MKFALSTTGSSSGDSTPTTTSAADAPPSTANQRPAKLAAERDDHERRPGAVSA